MIRNRRRPLSEAEDYALARVRSIASPAEGYYIAADDITKFGKYTASFDKKIEQHVTDKGWFREPPEKAISRWRDPRHLDSHPRRGVDLRRASRSCPAAA